MILLCHLTLIKQESLTVKAEKAFGGHLIVVIKDGKTYVLKLKNVKYSDTNSLEIRNEARVFFKEATIKLHVKAMFLSSFFLFLPKSKDKISLGKTYLLFFHSFFSRFPFFIISAIVKKQSLSQLVEAFIR